MRKMGFSNQVKGGQNNLTLTLDVWAKPQIKDGLNSVDKRMDIRIEGISLSSELLGPV